MSNGSVGLRYAREATAVSDFCKYGFTQTSAQGLAFPLVYDAGDEQGAYSADDGASYWPSCAHTRDPAFDANGGRAGYDFAQWSCDARSESCPVAPLGRRREAAGGCPQ